MKPCLLARFLIRWLPVRWQWRAASAPLSALFSKTFKVVWVAIVVFKLAVFGLAGGLVLSALKLPPNQILIGLGLVAAAVVTVYVLVAWLCGFTPRAIGAKIENLCEEDKSAGKALRIYKTNRLSLDLLDAWAGDENVARLSSKLINRRTAPIEQKVSAGARRL